MRNLDQFKAGLAQFWWYESEARLRYIVKWIDRSKEPVSINILKTEMLDKVWSPKSKAAILSAWINNVPRISGKRLVGLIEYIFVDKSNFTLSDNSVEHYDLILSWINKIKDVQVDELLLLAGSLESDLSKIRIIEAALKKIHNIPVKYVKEIIPSIKDHYYIREFFDFLIDKFEISIESISELVTAVSDDFDRTCILENWIEKYPWQLSVPEIIKLVKLVTDEKNKNTVVCACCKYVKILEFDEIELIAKEIGYTPVLIDLLITRIGSLGTRDKYSRFIELTNSDILGSRYNLKLMYNNYDKCILPDSLIPKFCRDLYPNDEAMQVELFLLFCAKGLPRDLIVEFTKTLSNDDLVFYFIKRVKNSLSKKDILEITSSRVSSKFLSISESFKSLTIKNSLKPEAYKTIQEIFGEALLQNKSLLDLFFYYDMEEPREVDTSLGIISNKTRYISGFTKFKSMLKPDILELFQKNYCPSDNYPYMVQVEYQKLNELISYELPTVSKLVNVLKPKIIKIPVLSSRDLQNYKMDFTGLEHYPPEKTEKLQRKFLEILTSWYPSDKKIGEFFESLYDMEIGVIKSDNRAKLSSLVSSKKAELAFLLSREGGVAKFIGIIGELSAGCVANIGTQLNLAILHSLLEGALDQVIYSVYSNSIAIPLLNSGGDNLGGSVQGVDVVNNNLINKSYIVPNALAKAIANEFEHSKPWDVVRNCYNVAVGYKITRGDKFSKPKSMETVIYVDNDKIMLKFDTIYKNDNMKIMVRRGKDISQMLYDKILAQSTLSSAEQDEILRFTNSIGMTETLADNIAYVLDGDDKKAAQICAYITMKYLKLIDHPSLAKFKAECEDVITKAPDLYSKGESYFNSIEPSALIAGPNAMKNQVLVRS